MRKNKRNSIKLSFFLPRKTNISLKMQRHAPFLRTQVSELSVLVFSEQSVNITDFVDCVVSIVTTPFLPQKWEEALDSA